MENPSSYRSKAAKDGISLKNLLGLELSSQSGVVYFNVYIRLILFEPQSDMTVFHQTTFFALSAAAWVNGISITNLKRI